TLTVTGITLDSGSGTLTVTSGPSITLSPSSGHQGTSVAISGSGFSPDDAGPCIISGSIVGLIGTNTCTISSTGTLQATSFSVGPMAPGTVTVTVTGSTNDAATTTFVVVTNSPSLTLTPASGQVLTGVTLTGSGFNTGDAAACTSVLSTPVNIVAAPTCHITGGQLTGSSFTVSSGATPGTYVVAVTGSSGDFATAVFTVTPPAPTITLTPNSGHPGTPVTITGSGFSPADNGACTSVLSSPTNIVIAPTCTINSSGQLIPPATFTAANTAALGTYVVTVKGISGDFASATFTVTGPSIALVPMSGPVSTAVTITGSGFSTGDAGACTSVLSTPTNIVAAPTCTITNTGQLITSSFTVSSGASPGIYIVTVKGSTGDFATAAFTVTLNTATLVLTPNSGPVLTAVTMTGSGFNTADVGACSSTLSTPSNIVAAPTCTINSGGQLTTSSFTVSSGATPGTYVVTVKGSSGDTGAATFTVTTNLPTITLTPNAGAPSTGVTVTGSGFNSADVGSCTSVLSTPTNIVTASTCSITASGQLTGSSFTVSITATPGTY